MVAGGGRALAGRYAARIPASQVQTRAEYLDGRCTRSATRAAWGVWLIVGLSVLFAALALVNTAAMATAERRDELATIRLLGGTAGQAVRMVALELAPIVAHRAGGGRGDRRGAPSWACRSGVRGIPLVVAGRRRGGAARGPAALALAAGLVTARIALRATPAAAMRVRD